MTTTPIAPQDRVLDWVSRHDPESRNYGIRSLVGSAVEPKIKNWSPGLVLDQGREGACVGFAFAAELAASPSRIPPKVTTDLLERYATGIYKDAQKIDAWQGESYEGTSVLAGAKVLKNRGLIGGYRWCFSVADIRDAIIAEGPVVIGIPWFESLYETRPSGLVEVSGSLVGGHAITLIGYHPKIRLAKEGYSKRFEVFRWRNSWGPSYGLAGNGYITSEDLATLLSDNGEACVPVDRTVPVIPGV